MKLHERNNAIFSSRLEPMERLVLLVLADAMSSEDPDRPVWLEVATLAERTGAAPSTVTATLKRLEDRGILLAERRAGRSTRRRIDWTALAAAEPLPAKKGGYRPKATDNRSTNEATDSRHHPTDDRYRVTDNRSRSAQEPTQEPPMDQTAGAREEPHVQPQPTPADSPSPETGRPEAGARQTPTVPVVESVASVVGSASPAETHAPGSQAARNEVATLRGVVGQPPLICGVSDKNQGEITMSRKKHKTAPPSSIDLAPAEHRDGWVSCMRLWATLKCRACPQDVTLPPAAFAPDKGVGRTVWELGTDPDVGWDRIRGRLLAAVEANNTNTGPMAKNIEFVRDTAGYEMLLRKDGAKLLPEIDAAVEQAELDRDAGIVATVPAVPAKGKVSRAFGLAMSGLFPGLMDGGQ